MKQDPTEEQEDFKTLGLTNLGYVAILIPSCNASREFSNCCKKIRTKKRARKCPRTEQVYVAASWLTHCNKWYHHPSTDQARENGSPIESHKAPTDRAGIHSFLFYSQHWINGIIALTGSTCTDPVKENENKISNELLNIFLSVQLMLLINMYRHLASIANQICVCTVVRH
jgi:hypothetical protein